MKNKRLEINRLKDKLLRHNCMNILQDALGQLLSTGKYAVEGNGGWVIGQTLL